MKPAITDTKFGCITVAGSKIEHDIVVRLSGKVEKQKKKLSKSVYGTSHTVSLQEAEHVYEGGADRLIVGTGQQGMVRLSEEAATYLKDRNAR